MAMSQAQFNTLLDLIEESIVAKNMEEYAAANPDPMLPPPLPPRSYATVSVLAANQFRTCTGGLLGINLL